MLLDHTVMVTAENGPRPAGKPDECFYCHQPVGSAHEQDCVLRKKLAIVSVQISIPIAVPSDWDSSEINAWMNEGSWGADNYAGNLETYLRATSEEGSCLCNSLRAECLRDATADDLEGIDLIKMTEDR